MLAEHLSASLRYFAGLALQPANRWDGFDLSAPAARTGELRGQIFFVGCALAALAAHPDADASERERGRAALDALIDRMIQRRVWAAWATEIERAARKPNPLDSGYGEYCGALATLLCLHRAIGGAPRYQHEPFVLRWSAAAHYSYTLNELVDGLWRQMRASPDGALSARGDDTTQASCMAGAIWACRLHGRVYGGDYAGAGDRWLQTLRERVALRGLRLPGRGALAGAYHLRSRRAGVGGDSLEDAWALAMTAPLDRDLAAALAVRHWPALGKIMQRGEALTAGFSYMLAVELGEAEYAAVLRDYAERQLAPLDDAAGRRYSGGSAATWVSALYAIGDAGGLGRLLTPAGT